MNQDRITQLGQLLAQGGANAEQSVTIVVQLAIDLGEERRFEEAEALLRYFIDGFSPLLSADHALVLWMQATLAKTIYMSGRAEEGLALYEKVVSRQRATLGLISVSTSLSLVELSSFYLETGKLDKALAITRELADASGRIWPNDPYLQLEMHVRLQRVYVQAARSKEANAVSHEIDARISGLLAASPSVPAEKLYSVAANLLALGADENSERAARLLEAALARLAIAGQAGSSTVLSVRKLLASTYTEQGRNREALALLSENIRMVRQTFGVESIEMHEALANYSTVLTKAGRYDDLRAVIQERIRIASALFGPDDPQTVDIYVELVPVLMRDGMTEDARATARMIYETFERTLGPDDTNTLAARLAYVLTLMETGNNAEAEAKLQALVPVLTSRLGPGHPFTLSAANSLSMMQALPGHTLSADSVADLKALLQNAATDMEAARLLDRIALAQFAAGFYLDMVETAGRARALKLGIIAAQHGSDAADTRAALGLNLTLRLHQTGALLAARGDEAEMLARGITRRDLLAAAFESTQLIPFDRTSEAVRQAAIRTSVGPGSLADDLRSRDLLQDQFRRIEADIARQSAGLGVGSGDIDASAVELSRLSREIVALDARIAGTRPDLEGRFDAGPVTLDDLQAGLLGDDDALILLGLSDDPTDSGFVVWVVTRQEVNVRFASGADAAPMDLHTVIPRFRAQLDRPTTGVLKLASRAPAMSNQAPLSAGMAPVELRLAHEIFNMLFGGTLADLLEPKHNWILVPQGEFLSLPFAALVTAPPTVDLATTPEDLRGARWLGAEKSLTVLPSADALRMLAAPRRKVQAELVYLGLGDPAFDGEPGPLRGIDQSATMRAADRIAAVRGLPQLAGAHDELARVAAIFESSNRKVITGRAASESSIVALAQSGDLARANIVHFATHGLLAGGLTGLGEPALALSPPDAPVSLVNGTLDDGLLTGSEIALLPLTADWVVLSACNTAGSGTITTDGLTGLAQAFFYAGARTLLVTHWSVRDDVAARVIGQTVAAGAAGDRAEAMRRAVASLIADTGTDNTAFPYAHPALWAPFHIIGPPR